jgi:hypothetical protein
MQADKRVEFRVKCPLFLPDIYRNLKMSTHFSRTRQYQIS